MEFKNYVGTKALKATPMTKGEYNKYRGWEMPSNEVAEEPGYFVEYQDGGKSNDSRHEGYVSWSPKDVFEKSYKENETFLQRLKIEEKELGEKIVALNNALSKDDFSGKVGYTQFELLNIQHSAMLAYRRVLNIRINDLNVQVTPKS